MTLVPNIGSAVKSKFPIPRSDWHGCGPQRFMYFMLCLVNLVATEAATGGDDRAKVNQVVLSHVQSITM